MNLQENTRLGQALSYLSKGTMASRICVKRKDN